MLPASLSRGGLAFQVLPLPLQVPMDLGMVIPDSHTHKKQGKQQQKPTTGKLLFSSFPSHGKGKKNLMEVRKREIKSFTLENPSGILQGNAATGINP